MAGTRSIAFVAHQVTLDHVPAEARVLPLEPTVSVDNKRRIASRPEYFLRLEDDAHVEKATERWAADWWRRTDRDAFNWNGVNLAECFAFALTFVVRDILKTSIIVDRIFEREHPEAVLCDVPASSGMFRPYPHLDGIGRLAASRSTATGLRFEPLYHASGVPKARSASALRLAYLSVASRRGRRDLASAGFPSDDPLGRAAHLLLVKTTSPLAKAMVRFARLKRIPATVVQHGILAGAFSYKQTEADRVAAWGASDADWFRRNLRSSARVEPTGSPRYDGLRSGARTRLPAVVARLPPSTPLVMFASQPFVQDRAWRSPWDRHAALEIVLSSVMPRARFMLVIKWHPAERPEPLPLDGRAATRIVTVQQADTFALIERSRIVLAVSSTVALEAMYLRRPVVFIGPPDPDSPFHPPEQGGGCRAETAADLSSILDRLLGDPGHYNRVLDRQAAFLARFYAPLDGRAAERVGGLLRGGSRTGSPDYYIDSGPHPAHLRTPAYLRRGDRVLEVGWRSGGLTEHISGPGWRGYGLGVAPDR